MKFESFKIENFRSIVDTDWQTLSPDNITSLIGQNESGKTSVLEALMAFEEGEISQDDLRNDESFPSIYCKFKLDTNELAEIFEDKILPKKLNKIIEKNNNSITLFRKWSSLEKHDFDIEDQNIKDCWNEAVETKNPQENTETAKQEDQAITTTPPVEIPITIEEFKNEIFNNAPQFILFEDNSLLPRTIDIEDIKNKNKKAAGYIGAENLLKIVNLDISTIESNSDNRILEDKINTISNKFTADFQKYWGQKIGKNDKITIQISLKNHSNTAEESKKGKPYLIFFIKDSNGRLYPDQRSKGVRWFISFYIQLEAMSKDRKNVILTDEPGNSLHGKAQEDVLKIFEKIKNDLQIVYTTHSPYLMDINHAYRILAVQRDEEENNNYTKIMSIQKLGGANTDTLLPLYTSIGVDLSHQRVIKSKNNVLLEEVSAFYYLKAFKQIIGNEEEMYFLPATGATNLPLLANLMCGWNLDFCVLLDDDSRGRGVYKILLESKIKDENRLMKLKGMSGIEDMFETKDFETIILKSAEKLAKNSINSDVAKKYSKPLLARDFLLGVEKGDIKKENLSPTTIKNIEEVLSKIKTALTQDNKSTILENAPQPILAN